MAYFLGLPWLHTWGSGRFSGVGRDALYLADHIEQRLRATSRATRPLRAVG
jgi:putative flavoprotein involved in K+ transport